MSSIAEEKSWKNQVTHRQNGIFGFLNMVVYVFWWNKFLINIYCFGMHAIVWSFDIVSWYWNDG